MKFVAVVALGWGLGAQARAEPQTSDAWAVVVGSNRPGPGQRPLRYALQDADRVADVFVELGGVPAEQVIRLDDPNPDDVLDALEVVGEALEEVPVRHRRVLFYYSGHARSGGLDLGDQILPLGSLRERLLALPADLRVVVLDACQSGALSTARGVTPAASFSTASVQGLDAEGTVIIASSAPDELSQESEAMAGGTFTHHFVVGLRGAADVDADGQVTLEEGYRYAYDRTVVSTAPTAIGRQHPSLTTDLRGQGALTLTRPTLARARLRFGVEDEGTVLLVHERTGVVAAEVEKVAGDELTLSLPPGPYTVSWTRDGRTRACRQTLLGDRATPFRPTNCVDVAPQATLSKGDNAILWSYERVFFEVGVGPLTTAEGSAYTERLLDFGYRPLGAGGAPVTTPSVQVSSSLSRNLSALVAVSQLDRRAWRRDDALVLDQASFRINAWRAGVGVRFTVPVLGDWVVPYTQAVGGVAIVSERYSRLPRVVGSGQSTLFGSLGAGLQLMPRIGRVRVLGVFGQIERTWDLGIENLLGDRHPIGGTHIVIGLRGGI